MYTRLCIYYILTVILDRLLQVVLAKIGGHTPALAVNLQSFCIDPSRSGFSIDCDSLGLLEHLVTKLRSGDLQINVSSP